MALAKRIDLDARLARFEIDETTKANLRLFAPILLGSIDRIVANFYAYLDRFPETRGLLKGHNVPILREKQKRHWLGLLSGEFGGDYINRSLNIGLAHFNARVPPHVYIAAYNFFINELMKIHGGSNQGFDSRSIGISVNKAVMFDMSIVLNAYMLDSFSGRAPASPIVVD